MPRDSCSLVLANKFPSLFPCMKQSDFLSYITSGTPQFLLTKRETGPRNSIADYTTHIRTLS